MGAALLFSFSSCTKTSSTIIIWTDRQELVSYTELFNATHNNVKAIAIYKENLIASMPPQKNEIQPDLVIGSWLKSSTTRKYFSPMDYIFSENKLSKNDFYPQMLEYGVLNDKQYLVPLSFNLPMMVFAEQNESLLQNDHIITLDSLKSAATAFNSTNKDGTFSSIGYAPSWDMDFQYEATKIFGANYQEKGQAFSFNMDAIDSTVDFMRSWTSEFNGDTENETSFQFKYLYMSKQRQVSSGRGAFAFMTSNQFFTLSNEQSTGLTFRWLVNADEESLVEDNIITMGIFKKSNNKKDAELFIEWLSDESTQAELMDRNSSLNLDTVTFGIAGGFSAIKSVNANVFPSHYRELLGNLPDEQNLELPLILPYRWPVLKANVIVAYLQTTTDTACDLESGEYATMDELVEDSKRFAY